MLGIMARWHPMVQRARRLGHRVDDNYVQGYSHISRLSGVDALGSGKTNIPHFRCEKVQVTCTRMGMMWTVQISKPFV